MPAARLTKDDVNYIAEDMLMAARENASETVIAEHGGMAKVKAEYGYLDNHPDWEPYFLLSLENCLTSPVDYLPRAHAGRKLSEAELLRVIKALEVRAGLSFVRGSFRRV